jgi:pimeloyl-ACP methyl ester carboxylesterase
MGAASLALILIMGADAAAPQSKYFDSAGVKLHYRVMGKGEPVLLIHGFAANMGAQWLAPKVADELAKEYQVILLDNRGHGQSAKPREPEKYGVEMVEDQVRLLDHLKIAKANVVGYSMGGLITSKLVEMHPERLRCAVIGGAGAIRPEQMGDRIGPELAESLEAGKGIRPLLVELQPAGRPIDEDRLRTMNSMAMAFNDSKALAAVVRGLPNLATDLEKLKNNQVPTLCLIGEVDPMKARTVDPIAAHFGNLRIEVISKGDHMDTFFKRRFLDWIRAFLKNPQSPEVPAQTAEPAKKAA